MGGVQAKYEEYVITTMVSRVEPLNLVRGRGALLYDDGGAAYIDGFAGVSVVNAGHCDPDISAAVKAQVDQLVHCCSYVYHVQVVADLAEKLAEITPGRLKKTFFANSGAEANEGAMRIAKQHTGRDEFVALQASFHGRTVGTLSVSGNSARKTGGGPYLPGVAFAPAPYCYRCPFAATYPACGLRCAEELRNVIRFSTSGDVAAFIAEPVLGEGGIIVPPPEYFSVVRWVYYPGVTCRHQMCILRGFLRGRGGRIHLPSPPVIWRGVPFEYHKPGIAGTAGIPLLAASAGPVLGHLGGPGAAVASGSSESTKQDEHEGEIHANKVKGTPPEAVDLLRKRAPRRNLLSLHANGRTFSPS